MKVALNMVEDIDHFLFFNGPRIVFDQDHDLLRLRVIKTQHILCPTVDSDCLHSFVPLSKIIRLNRTIFSHRTHDVHPANGPEV